MHTSYACAVVDIVHGVWRMGIVKTTGGLPAWITQGKTVYQLETNMPKIHLVLRGMALCDYQLRDGGRHATTSIKEFKACGDEACKECARKLAKLQQARKR